jgi:hypothetical protein
MSTKRIKTPQKTKLKITLSDRDNALLLQYAREHNVSRAVAAKQIIHQVLVANKKNVSTIPENQLSIFDNGVQINIFDIIDNE